MTFKQAARKILKEKDSPLHYNEITEIALEQGLIETEGRTPEKTMNAYLSTDIKNNGENSVFFRSRPGYYGVNLDKSKESKREKEKSARNEISKNLGLTNTQQKGEIAENRVMELITLYGNEGLSCYRPVADDEGIDIIVKRRGKLDVSYIQVKSSWGENFVATVKEEKILNKIRMLLVFVYFDLLEGDLSDQIFCIPAPKFKELTRFTKAGDRTFSVDPNAPEKSKFSEYMIEKRELADEIIGIIDKL